MAQSQRKQKEKTRVRLAGNSDAAKIVTFIEKVLGLSTGETRNARGNCLQLASLTGAAETTLFHALYSESGGYSVPMINNIVLALVRNGLSEEQKGVGKSLDWGARLLPAQRKKAAGLKPQIEELIEKANDKPMEVVGPKTILSEVVPANSVIQIINVGNGIMITVTAPSDFDVV